MTPLTGGAVGPAGTLTAARRRPFPGAPSIDELIAWGRPLREVDGVALEEEVRAWRKANWPQLAKGLRRIAFARALGLPHFHGVLWLTRLHPDGRRVPYGLASVRLVTNAGAGYVVDSFQNLVALEEMRYHGYGTGSTAEAAGDTALVTELTTQYPVNSTRPQGTLAEGSAQVFRTVATLDPDADVTIAEHGIFSDVDVAQGVLLDRSVFAGIPLTGATGDALETTYDFTVNSGN